MRDRFGEEYDRTVSTHGKRRDAEADLTAVATAPDDAVIDDLIAIYRTVSGGEHPDWDEFRAAMVEEGRLVAKVRPGSVTGQIR